MPSDKNQMWQLKLRDIVFFNKDKGGNLRQSGQKKMDKWIMDTEGEKLRRMKEIADKKMHAYNMKLMGNHI